MFIRLFRSNSSSQVLLFLLLAVLLWWDAFVHPAVLTVKDPVFNVFSLLQRLAGPLPIVSVIAAFVILLLEAFLLNHIMVAHDLAPRNTFMAGFLYFTWMSHTPPLLSLHPVLLANFLLILIMSALFKVYDRQDDSYKYIYTSGFLAALAALVYPPASVFLLLIWITLLIYRFLEWREWFIVLLGFVTPFLYYLFYFFWNDLMLDVFQVYRHYFSSVQTIFFQRSFYSLTFWIISGLLLLISFFRLSSSLNSKVISIRKKYTILVWILLIPALSAVFSGNLQEFHMALFFPGLAGLLVYYFSNVRKVLWPEILFGLVLVLIVLNKFFP